MRMRFVVSLLTVLLGATPRIVPTVGEPTEMVWTTAYVEVRSSITTCTVLVTAYNSEVDQTDDTPHLTSSQTATRWGVAAARWLPIGAKVQLPIEFGAEVFVVEDRMPPKNWCKLDLWHEELSAAGKWGKQFEEIAIWDAPVGFTCPDLPSTIGHKCPDPQTDWGRDAAKPICPSWMPGCEAAPVRVAAN